MSLIDVWIIGDDYRVETLLILYPSITGMSMQSFGSIGQFWHA